MSKCCPTDKGPAECEYTAEGEGMYITGPLNSTKGILLVSDIFGMHHNSFRYADTLGKAGFLVVMPDFFGSKAWSASDFPPDRSSEKWQSFWKLCQEFDTVHLPKAKKGVELLRQMGCKKIASVGMCWGARLAFDLAGENLVEAAATAHPGQTVLSADAVKKALNKPMCIMLSKDEGPFEEVEAVAKTSTFSTSVYERYNKLPHGFFGCRFDYDKCTKEELEEMNAAVERSLKFFREALA